MLRTRARAAGVSLIELMIGLAIIGMLLMIGLPAMGTWLNNTQIRTAGETLLAGMTLARNEAVRRNRIVRFQLVDSLDASCVLSTSGTSWVVSLSDPAGKCNTAISDTTDPQILDKKSGAEGAPKAVIAASGASTAYFNGVGRLSTPGGAANVTQIDITNPTGGACQHVDANGAMRCLRVTVSTAGEVKLCDPKVTDATDPRMC